jgi:hypothetical protein
MDDERTVTCPWCLEPIEMYFDPQSQGEMFEDCAVCCRPWRMRVRRGFDGELELSIERAT